jgi:hypothetical protein
MKRISTILIAVAVPLAFASPSIAQESKVLGTVNNGRTTIIFEAANDGDLPVQQLQAWGDFAAQHPDIANQLAHNNRLIGNNGYVQKHSELAQFFSEHPDIQEAMEANPGNYVAIPPRPGE